MSDEQTWSDEIKKLGDSIVSLTLMQAKQLSDYLKEEHGLEAAAAPAMMAAAPAGEAGGGAEEKTEFDVVLENCGDKKIQVIKAVREVTSLGLKEAKELVDNLPKPLKEGVAKEEAESLKTKMEEAGATVTLK